MASFPPALPNTADNDFDQEIDESQSGYHSGGPGQTRQSPILVLSQYSALIDTVRKAAPRGVPVVQASDLYRAAEKMPSLRPGVLVADTASSPDIGAMVAQLTQQFPDLVVIVAGQREDNATLMQLTTSAQFFRFLLVPLSHGQTRHTLEAAIARHQKLTAPPEPMEVRSLPSEDAKKSYATSDVAFAVGLGAGLAVLLGGAWWFASRMTSAPEVPVVEAPTTTTAPIAPPPTRTENSPDPLKAELALARNAFALGMYVEPVGESALDYYRSALNIDPNSTAAQEGLRSVTTKILEQAESALIAEKIEDADRALEMAREVDPQDPRLGFVAAQVERQRERLKPSQGQDVSRKIDGLVAKASALMNQGRLTVPNGGSARDALLEARRLDPTNPTVAQGLRDLSQALMDEANRSIKAGNLNGAQSLVTSARQLGYSGPSLAAAEEALAALRDNTVVNRPPRATPLAKTAPAAEPVTKPDKEVVADIRRMLSEGKLIDPQGDNAKDALAMLRATDPARAEIIELANTLSARLLDASKQAAAAKAFDRSQQLLTAARDVGASGNDGAISQAERELTEARTSTAGSASTIVPASTLRRIKMVEPVYPAAARRRNEKGVVEVLFTVTPDGGVDNVEVRKSNPARVFDDAAIKAVEQWQFEPVQVNGQPVSQRAVVRLMFSLD